jgi:hypothetical protein
MHSASLPSIVFNISSHRVKHHADRNRIIQSSAEILFFKAQKSSFLYLIIFKCYSGIYTETNIRLFSYAELRSATDNFNRTNKVGRGGFGTVYKVIFISLGKSKRGYFLLN